MALRNLIFSATAAVLLAAATPAAQARSSIKAHLDSATMQMGRQNAILFEITQPAGAQTDILFDKNAMPREVELAGWTDGDTTDVGSGIVSIRRALVVQAFDSGVYVIPPFYLLEGPDTIATQPMTLKVNPVDVSEMTDVHPIAPIVKFESKWYDFLPDFLTDYWVWIVLGLLIIAGGICAYLLLTKKVAVNLMPQRRRLPPDVIAMNRLNALREQSLWEKGQEKEYYTKLIDILRDYLHERFGINAMEMTSTQIIRHLSDNEQTRLPNKYMRKILEIADIVKFAKVRPLPDDNVRAIQDAIRFVDETKPQEAPSEEETPTDSASPTSAASQPTGSPTASPAEKS